MAFQETYSQNTRPDFAGGVESGLQDGDQQFLAKPGGGFVNAFVPFDARDAMQQSDDPAGQAFWIGDAIAAQAFAEIFGFAVVEHAFTGAAEEINAGSFR